MIREVLTRFVACALGFGLATVLLWQHDFRAACIEPQESVVLLDYVTGQCYTVWAKNGEILSRQRPCDEVK